MASNTVLFEQNKTSTASLFNQPSPAIWHDCPSPLMFETPGIGNYFYDDFQQLPLPGTITTQIALGMYKAFASSGCTIAPVSSINSNLVMGGALAFTGDTTAGHSLSLAQSYGSNVITGNVKDGGKLWWEACIAVNSLVTTNQGFFLGLGETQLITLAAGVPLNGSGGSTPSAGGSLIGFNMPASSVGPVNTVYTDRATSFVSVQASAANISAAFTLTKLGMVYDPTQPINQVTFYQDNVPLTTQISATTLQGLTNLNANNLGLIFAAVVGAAAATPVAYLKWWRLAQLYPNQTP